MSVPFSATVIVSALSLPDHPQADDAAHPQPLVDLDHRIAAHILQVPTTQ